MSPGFTFFLLRPASLYLHLNSYQPDQERWFSTCWRHVQRPNEEQGKGQPAAWVMPVSMHGGRERLEHGSLQIHLWRHSSSRIAVP